MTISCQLLRLLVCVLLQIKRKIYEVRLNKQLTRSKRTFRRRVVVATVIRLTKGLRFRELCNCHFLIQCTGCNERLYIYLRPQ